MPVQKKVLHLVSADCGWAAASGIAALAAALREKGWSSAVTAPEHSLLDEFADAAGVETEHFALAKSMNPLAWMELAGVVKKHDPCLVHVHDPEAASMASRSGWFSSSVGLVVSRRELDTPISSAEYGGAVKAVICSSEAVEEAFKKTGKAEGKTRVVYGGVNLASAARAVEDRQDIRIQYRDAFCPGKEKPLFLVNMTPLRAGGGHADLLEAFPEILTVLPQTHLIIMAEGPEQAELERQIRITALENDVVIMPPDKAYLRLLAAADVYVDVSSDDCDGFLLQSALAAGRAVAASDSGCHDELVETGKTGVLVPEAGAAAIKEAVLDLLENRTRREHLGRMGQAHAAKAFDIQAQAGKVAEIYQEAAGA